jgi:hypothetical protein
MAHTRPGTYVLYREAMSEQYTYPAITYTDDLAPLDIQCSRPPTEYATLVLLIPEPPELYRLYVSLCPYTSLLADKKLVAGPQLGNCHHYSHPKNLALLSDLRKS